MAQSKIFDNKQYILDRILPTKVRANAEAAYQRGWGRLARVVKNKHGGYAVYTHWRK
jgi:hypothetical protein